MEEESFNPDLNRAGVNRYKPVTFENNWNEDRFDKNYIKQHKPLTQTYSNTYETTYKNLTNNLESPSLLQEKANLVKVHRVVAYPGYQPEMSFRDNMPTYETESRVNYLNPKLKMFPIDFQKLLQK